MLPICLELNRLLDDNYGFLLLMGFSQKNPCIYIIALLPGLHGNRCITIWPQVNGSHSVVLMKLHHICIIISNVVLQRKPALCLFYQYALLCRYVISYDHQN